MDRVLETGKPARKILRFALMVLLVLVLLSFAQQAAQAAAGDVELCSSDAAGVQGNNNAGIIIAISANGGYVAFTSVATNLVPGGTTNQQVFRKDIKTGETLLCSSDAAGTQANAGCSYPFISADGRYVTFRSAATNLVPGGTTGDQLFRKDVLTGEVRLISADAAGIQGNGNSEWAAVSGDARYVSFFSGATNLIPGGTTGTQVFRKDLQTGAVNLCSADAAGTQGNNGSLFPNITEDGRYVAFFSAATNLVPGVTTNQQVFRKDLQTGTVNLCSSDAAGTQGDSVSVFPDISSDGRYVSFYSAATNLVPGGTTNQQVFRKDLQTGTVNLCSSDAAGVEGNGPSSWAQVSYDGRFVVFYAAATNLIAGGTTGQQVFRKDLQTGTVNLCSADAAGTEGNAGSSYPAINSDGRYTVFTSAATNLALGGTTGQQVFRKELAAPYTFYFAEGFTGANFQEYLTLGNPNAGPIQVTITYLFTGAAPQEQSVTVPGTSRATINVNSVVGSNKNVSLKVTSDSSFVAERPMYFNYQGAWSGGHDVVGANMASTNWYFAEGYTGSGFDEWVCVLNPGTITANLTFRFQTQEEGEKVITGRTVPANSRETFKANDLLSGGSFQTSLKLESDSAIVAERPMYFNYQGKVSRNWEGGHCVMGLPILSSQYYLAEGTTRGVFDEWLTLQNPNPTPINVQATYQLGPGQGAPIAKSYPIGANSRSSIYVPDEIGTEKDTSVYLTSNSPFLAERPMYFNYQGTASRGWQGGHCVIGAPSTAQDWFFAEGFTASNFEEWLTIQNPGSTDAQVQVIYYTQEAGALPVRTETIPADTRQTLLVNTHAGANYQLSARIVVISGPDLVVERPMYFNFNGWDGGSDVMGYNP